MTPVNLEATLNLPLPEPTAYRATTPKLEPNNCFDGHLQRASEAPQADRHGHSSATQESSLPDRTPAPTATSPVEQSPSENPSPAQVANGDRDEDEEKKSDVEQSDAEIPVVADLGDQQTEVEPQTESPILPDEAGVLVAEVPLGKTQTETASTVEESKPAVPTSKDGSAAARHSRSKPLAQRGVGPAKTNTTQIEQPAPEQVGTEKTVVEPTIAVHSTAEEPTRILAGKRTQEPKDKEAKPVVTEGVESADVDTVAEEGSVEAADKQEPDQQRSRKPKSSRASSVENNLSGDKLAVADQQIGATTANATSVAAEGTLAAAVAAAPTENLTSQESSASGEKTQSAIRALDGVTAKSTIVPSDNVTPAAQRLAVGIAPPKSQQSGSNLSEVDRVRFVQRVARAVQSAGDRGGSMRLRLSPPELGSLRLEVTIKNGTMTARVEAESASARSLLLDNLPELKQRLAEQQIKIERFDVDLMDRNSSELPQQSESRSQSQSQRMQAARGRNRVGAAEPVTRNVVSTPVRLPGSGQLNIVV